MRVRHTTGQNFYLERNYVDMMTYIGWNHAAYEVVDAAVQANNQCKHPNKTRVLETEKFKKTLQTGTNPNDRPQFSRNIFVMALVIGFVSYSYKIFYSY